MMRIFVSYTRRDGVLSGDALARLENILAGVGEVYIDALHNCSRFPQAHVLAALRDSNLVIACDSPSFAQSEWTRIELALARECAIPVIRINVAQVLASCAVPEHVLSYCRRAA
jgi:hypothetical protein